MAEKTQNRIEELAERSRFRLDVFSIEEKIVQSRTTSQKASLNTLRSSENKRTLKGSREKNQQSNKSIAITKE